MLGIKSNHKPRFAFQCNDLYLLVIIVVGLLVLASNIFLFSQTVRTAPNKVILIGASYVLTLDCNSALPLPSASNSGWKVVYTFIEEEFLRSFSIAFASLPVVSHREGWGVPDEVRRRPLPLRFRTAILDTVSSIDTASHAVIPSMSPLSPRVQLAHHLRHFLPLLTLSRTSATHKTDTSDTGMHVASISSAVNDVSDEAVVDVDMDGPEVYFRRYTAAVELAKYCEREMSEVEFEDALEAAGVLKGILDAYKAAFDEHQSH